MINCIIINGHTMTDCDIDIPVEATLGEVISDLVRVGFMDEDITVAPIVFYNKDNGVVYKERNMTIEECGWEDGQTLVAVYYAS